MHYVATMWLAYYIYTRSETLNKQSKVNSQNFSETHLIHQLLMLLRLLFFKMHAAWQPHGKPTPFLSPCLSTLTSPQRDETILWLTVPSGGEKRDSTRTCTLTQFRVMNNRCLECQASKVLQRGPWRSHPTGYADLATNLTEVWPLHFLLRFYAHFD